MTAHNNPLVGIVMGSDSDWPSLQAATEICAQFKVVHEIHVVSAHRTPDDMSQYAKNAYKKGLKVIIAGAGGAAHLPGMIASNTPLPVIGVPIKTDGLGGMDSLLSIVQMPSGVPVATVAIGAGKNAGLLAMQILATSNTKLMEKLIEYKNALSVESRKKDATLNNALKK